MSSRLLAERYELLEKIGDGGMAMVYKARDKLLNRFVAVKILKPEFAREPKIIESFRRESQAAASLSHPNIVNVFDVGREGNVHYIVMELIDGRVLSDIIREEGPADYRRALEIGKQIAAALSVAHKNHIIHRDVKPLNILITEDGTAKITDFGIAKAADSRALAEGDTSTIIGSVHYFSPEQARGGYIDEKSDIYSLGIVLYELVTGKVPFDGENPVSVALMHINDEITPPSRLVSGIPPAFENIILKATNKYQINRYKSADEMLEAMKDAEIVASIVGTPAAASKGKNAAEENAAEKPAKKEIGGGKGKTGGQGEAPVKKKMKINRVKLLVAVIALLCAIPVSGLIVSGISGWMMPKNVKVPDLTGMDYEEAEAALAKQNLKIERGDEVIAPDYEEGQVVSQDPKKGSVVVEGNRVKVNISQGSKEGTVPNVLGKTFEEAVFLLERYGYVQGSVSSRPGQEAKDSVVSQKPEAGARLKKGKAVDLVVSTGSQTGAVPNLVGLPFEKAREKLEEKKLAVGDVVYEASPIYNKGIVIWQQEFTGASLPEGTKINLKVSTGSEPAGPRSVAIDVDYSRAANSVFYLTVVVNDETGTRTLITREQRIKENGSEILSVSGQGKGTVTVIFDEDVVMEKTVDFTAGTVQ